MWVDSLVISILMAHCEESEWAWKKPEICQRLLKEVDIKRNQLIIIFSEREDERLERRKKRK